MSARSDKAVEYKRSGMNCAQSAALAFADMVDMDEAEIAAMTQTFGVGIGATMEGTCGAVVGANIMLGLIDKDDTRPNNMKKAKEMLLRFKEQNKAVTCRNLKGIDTGVVLRECNDCVADAVLFLEDILEAEGK